MVARSWWLFAHLVGCTIFLPGVESFAGLVAFFNSLESSGGCSKLVVGAVFAEPLLFSFSGMIARVRFLRGVF